MATNWSQRGTWQVSHQCLQKRQWLARQGGINHAGRVFSPLGRRRSTVFCYFLACLVNPPDLPSPGGLDLTVTLPGANSLAAVLKSRAEAKHRRPACTAVSAESASKHGGGGRENRLVLRKYVIISHRKCIVCVRLVRVAHASLHKRLGDGFLACMYREHAWRKEQNTSNFAETGYAAWCEVAGWFYRPLVGLAASSSPIIGAFA